MNIEVQRTFTFKTNINCGGCIAKIRPVLDATAEIAHWAVDTANPNKVLTIVSDGITEQEIIKVVKENGFNIESVG